MQSGNNIVNEASVKQAMKLASSKEGRQLMAMLQQTNSAALNAAMKQAANGNYDAVRETLSSLMNTSDAQELLKKLGEK